MKTKKKARILKGAVVLFGIATMALPVYADDPLATINNLSTFIFAAIRAIGVILLGWGVVQIGMSLQSHDPSQRTNGFLTFFGGLLIAFSKAILDLILG
jgi:uncharacterized membrane protein